MKNLFCFPRNWVEIYQIYVTNLLTNGLKDYFFNKESLIRL